MHNGLIELGEVPREPPPVVDDPRPPLSGRVLLGALSLLLLPLLAAGGHRVPPRPPTVIPARLGDTTYVADGRLFVVGAGPELRGSEVRNRIVGTYSLPEAKLLSLTTVAVSGRIYDVRQAGNTVVVAYQINADGAQAVVALTAGTDRALWRRAGGLIAVSAADRLVLLDTPEAETGVDLTAGTDRWSVPQQAGGGVTEAGWADGYPRWLVSTTGAGRLETRDARTATVLASTAVPVSAGASEAVGDLVLSGIGPAGLTAYHLPDLTRRWRSDVDLSQSWTRTACGAAICAFRPEQGVTVLDPATGRRLWTAERWTFAEPAGPYLIATVAERGRGDPQQWILDTATGRVLGDFGPWQALGPGPSPGLLYGKRDTPGAYVVWYGVLDPRTRQPSILGAAQQVSTDCRVAPDVLICRLVDASVAVWRLR